jgi:hypothetical protein
MVYKRRSTKDGYCVLLFCSCSACFHLSCPVAYDLLSHLYTCVRFPCSVVQIRTQVYSIENDTWKSYNITDETNWRSDNAGFADNNGVVYFVGGYDPSYHYLATVFAVDAQATLTTGIVQTVERAPLLFARGDLTAVTDPNQTYAIVSGGFGDAVGFCAPLLNVERYNFATDKWSEIDQLNRGRGDKALVEFKDHFFALGGERQIEGVCQLSPDNEPEVGEQTIAVDDVEVYYPETDTWETLVDDLPNHRFRFVAIGYDDVDAMYTFGGQLSYDGSCQCYRTTDSVYIFAEKDKHTTASNAAAPLICVASLLVGTMLALAV